MSSRLLHPDEYELASRSSVESEGSFNLDDDDFEAQVPSTSRNLGARKLPWARRVPWLSRILSSTSTGYRRLQTNSRPILTNSTPRCRLFVRRRCWQLQAFVGIILALVALTSVLRPSYTHPPAHYSVLRASVQDSAESGRGNLRNEKVFIVASIYDRGGELASGDWGSQLLQLIDLLGAGNVFVSIYENDSGEEGQNALRVLENQITSEKSIVYEEHLDPKTVPSVTIPGGEKRVKRIEYLAYVRNKALFPLAQESAKRYDKVLYLNDVFFNPVDAVQLLFSTNANEDQVAQYRAACAVDFINAFKFYDTFATRDLQGYSMGLPFFPWFTTSGSAESRKDVRQGKDAVRVRSCWGGMVAFDAKYFQPLPDSGKSPVRFRASPDLFWEASECCLIHADIQDHQMNIDDITDTGIYMNPYVRVAYDPRTLSWLGVTRRFEKLYSFIHTLGNHLVGLPWHNPRRKEVPRQLVREKGWVADETQESGGSFQFVDRTAGNDGFCGRRGLSVIVEDRKPGQKGYESIPIPSS